MHQKVLNLCLSMQILPNNKLTYHHNYIICFSMIIIIFSCAIENYDKRVPTDVSLTLTRCEAPTNLLKVENDQVDYKGPRHHITACIGQIYNEIIIDDINQLVEMVEVNFMLGVDLVVLYSHTSSDILDPTYTAFNKMLCWISITGIILL